MQLNDHTKFRALLILVAVSAVLNLVLIYTTFSYFGAARQYDEMLLNSYDIRKLQQSTKVTTDNSLLENVGPFKSLTMPTGWYYEQTKHYQTGEPVTLTITDERATTMSFGLYGGSTIVVYWSKDYPFKDDAGRQQYVASLKGEMAKAIYGRVLSDESTTVDGKSAYRYEAIGYNLFGYPFPLFKKDAQHRQFTVITSANGYGVVFELMIGKGDLQNEKLIESSQEEFQKLLDSVKFN